MKKFVLLACVAMVAFGLMLTACGNDSNMQVPTTVPTTEAHTHAFGEWVTVKDATCNEEGEQERVCACGEKETMDIPILCSPGLEYTVNSDGKTCTVTGIGTCTDTEIFIGAYIDGYQVKLVSDTSYGSLWEVSFTLKEF